MGMRKSKVYVLTDEHNRIIRCEGGYSVRNIVNISEWSLIDEGVGDRYNLCQSLYFEDSLFTEDEISQYKLIDGEVIRRTTEEIEADRVSRPQSVPTETTDDILNALLGVTE